VVGKPSVVSIVASTRFEIVSLSTRTPSQSKMTSCGSRHTVGEHIGFTAVRADRWKLVRAADEALQAETPMERGRAHGYRMPALVV
jgi:hypothetical protein